MSQIKGRIVVDVKGKIDPREYFKRPARRQVRVYFYS